MTTVIIGDCRETLKTLPDESVQCCVTSPPYWGLRDYGHADQIGQEATPELFVQTMVEVFREVRRVLKADGTCWLNLGDTYANDGKWGGSSGGKHAKALHGNTGIGRGKVKTGLKPKDLVGIPWMTALALRADGWYLRQDIIWAKPNPMPESVTDRCTKSHEYIFLLSKSERYYFDSEAVKEKAVGGASGNAQRKSRPNQDSLQRGDQKGSVPWIGGETRNRRSIWTVTTKPYKGAHFATFPPDLIRPCILAGSKPNDTVLDPFGGSGTTGMVAQQEGRKAILCELNPKYEPLINNRCGIFNEQDFWGE